MTDAPDEAVKASRIDHDVLGDCEIPADALYGVHTVRALQNFPLVGPRVADIPELASAFGLVKLAAARANVACGVLSGEVASAIIEACAELAAGAPHMRAALTVPLLQGGAGTSTNMNVNEVIANRALELLGRAPGEYEWCHPNDHVNRSQSTNDVYPTALRLALLIRHRTAASEVDRLIGALRHAAERFAAIPKLARTQLRDAVPMTVGDEFAAWADSCGAAREALERARDGLTELNLGGTAVGTGLAAPARYAEHAISCLAEISGVRLRAAENAVSATTDATALLGYSAAIRTAAVSLAKLANDLRLLSSGPRTGLGELELPAVQAGSSMMPGKINPVIPEFANQVAFRIHGLDTTITMALDAAQLQLNAMLPVAASSLLEAQTLLGSAAQALTDRCIDGIEINEERTRSYVDDGLGKTSVLAATLGYEASSALATEAARAGLPPDRLVEQQSSAVLRGCAGG